MPIFSQLRIKTQHLVVAAVLFAICLVTYSNSLTNDFMMDDYGLLLDDPLIHNIKFLPYQFVPDLHRFLNIGHSSAVYYRPLAHAFPMVCYLIFKTNPFGYHVVNLFLFYMCCFLIYILVSTVTQQRGWGFLTALLYATHPMNGIFVNYITASVFGIQVSAMTAAAILFYRNLEKGRSFGQYSWSSLVLFVVACLCHETAMVMPFYLMAMAYFLKGRNIPRSLLMTLPYWLLLASYFGIRLHFASLQGSVLSKFVFHQMNVFEYLASLTTIIVWYGTRLIVPHDIVLIWATPIIRDHLFLWNISLILIISVCLFFLRFRERHPITVWAGSWLLLGFLPVTLGCLFQPTIGIMIEPHWLLFASIGFFTLLAGSIVYLYKRNKNKFIVIILTLFLLGTYINSSRSMNSVWGNERQYCHFWLKNVPGFKSVMFYLAKTYFATGEFPEAKKYYTEALENQNTDWQIYTNLGLMAASDKNWKEAVMYYRKALVYDPDSAIVYNNLGIAFAAQKLTQNAESSYQQAIHLNPYLLEPRLNLAKIYQEEGKEAQAEQLCLKNLAITPDHEESLAFLIELYLKNNNLAAATDFSKKILSVGRKAERLTNLGSHWAEHKAPELAKSFYLRALAVNPNYPDSYVEFGKLLGNYGQLDMAIALWEQGQQTFPHDDRFAPLLKEINQMKAAGSAH